jgi:hypothetical protein
MWAKQPKPRLIGVIELGQLVRPPFKGEQLLQLGWLWLSVSLLPPGKRLRGAVEELRDLSRADTGSILNGIESYCHCTGRHRLRSVT